MEYVRIGNSGLKITQLTFGSALTIGTENSTEEYANNLVNKAWDLGIRSFDTSNNYGSGMAETLLGKSLSEYPRQEFVLATKGSWPIGDTWYYKGLSRKHILWAFEQSLQRLGVEYVDIYYAHRFDSETSMEEIVRTFNYLINQGRIRYWATSEWPLDALRECIAVCDALNAERPIAEQFLYSYAVQKAVINGVKNFCESNGMGTLGFSPLCQGFLTGKYINGIPQNSRVAKAEMLQYSKTKIFYDQNKDQIERFLRVCANHSVKPTAVALQWSIRNGIYPVFGASSQNQLIENVEALEMRIPDGVWGDLKAPASI